MYDVLLHEVIAGWRDTGVLTEIVAVVIKVWTWNTQRHDPAADWNSSGTKQAGPIDITVGEQLSLTGYPEGAEAFARVVPDGPRFDELDVPEVSVRLKDEREGDVR